MPKLNQQGAAHILLILILLAGIVGGVYLVTSGHPLKIFSKAFETQESAEELTNKLISLNNQGSRSAQDTDRIAQMITIASKRQEKLLNQLDQDPALFIQNATLFDRRNEFPQEIKNFIEEQVEVSGILSSAHLDNKKTAQTIENFLLQDSRGEVKEVQFVNSPSQTSLGEVSINQAIQLNNRLVINSEDQTKPSYKRQALAEGSSEAPKEKLALFVVRFDDDSSLQPDSEKLVNKAFGEVNNFYNQASLGKFKFQPTLLGSYTIPHYDPNHSRTTEYGKCPYVFWYKNLQQQIKNNSINLTPYSTLVFIFTNPVNECNFLAGYFKTLPQSMIYVMEPKDSINLTHELGHALSLTHANALECAPKQIDKYSNCKQPKYYQPFNPPGTDSGDDYDVMGFTGHLFNAPHLIQLGWVPQFNIKVVSGEGDYVIENPLYKEANNSTQVLVIPKADTYENYYLSFRKKEGFDADLPDSLTSGVNIHISKDTVGAFSRFLDMFPTSRPTNPPSYAFFPGFSDAALKDGSFFFDQENQILVTQLGSSEKGIKVSVKFNVTQPPSRPTTVPTPISQPTSTPLPPQCQGSRGGNILAAFGRGESASDFPNLYVVYGCLTRSQAEVAHSTASSYYQECRVPVNEGQINDMIVALEAGLGPARERWRQPGCAR